MLFKWQEEEKLFIENKLFTEDKTVAQHHCLSHEAIIQKNKINPELRFISHSTFPL